MAEELGPCEVQGAQMKPHASPDLALAARAWIHSSDYVDMTFRQAALLSLICDEPGPHRVRELARSLGVEKPVVSRCADTFGSIGLAKRVSDPEDRRSVLIEATALGRSTREAMRLRDR